jgi:hypothetical protein
MGAFAKIRWLRVLLGGFLVEVALIVVVIPISLLPRGQTILLYVVPPACLVMTFLFGWWTARRVDAAFMLHGTLVGVVAALLYIALTWGQTLPAAYIASHGLKVVGGAMGGVFAGRQIKHRAEASVHAV